MTKNQCIIIVILTILVIFINYINYATNKIGEKFYSTRKKHKKTNPKIYDISHKYLPNLHEYENNIINIIPIGITIPFIKHYKILIEVIILFIIIMIIRSVLIYVTILPGHSKCENKNYNIAFSGGCYDKIISGHTAWVFLASLTLNKYKILSKEYLILINLLNSMFLLSTRAHYTIDILLGYLITGFIFHNNINVNVK